MLHDISFPIWRRIFKLGLDFQELKPWTWMSEDVVFAVAQPETGEVGYCVFLGNTHPQKGLVIFKGDRGIHSYLSHWQKEKKVLIDSCILLTFAGIDKFSKVEKDLFEWLELDEKSNLPLVRDYETGMKPWPLEEEESARLVMFAIEQSIGMAIRFKSERMLSAPAASDNFNVLFRVPSGKGAMLLWKDQWKNIGNDHPSVSQATANRLFLRSNCKDLPRKKQKEWLMEIFASPRLRKPASQRPYYPFALIVLDADTHTFIGEFMFLPNELHEHLQIRIKDLLVIEGYLPGKFVFVGEENMKLMEGIADELGIKTELAKEVPEIMEEMKAKLIGGSLS